ncbi:hypothetical protein [Nostoc sp.]|uniref:hypothetical protein n=1 Tax=Nostoc sp. TaxID=1180 RepID=UPI002FF7C096
MTVNQLVMPKQQEVGQFIEKLLVGWVNQFVVWTLVFVLSTEAPTTYQVKLA